MGRLFSLILINFALFRSHKPVKLGEGSYGEVFKTQIDGHEVALKVRSLKIALFTFLF
jgi:hypothetical protein